MSLQFGLFLLAIGSIASLSAGCAVVFLWYRQGIWAITLTGIALIATHVLLFLTPPQVLLAPVYSGRDSFTPEHALVSAPDWSAWGDFAVGQYGLFAHMGIAFIVFAALLSMAPRVIAIMERHEDHIRLKQAQP